jgi:hypothetical protein
MIHRCIIIFNITSPTDPSQKHNHSCLKKLKYGVQVPHNMQVSHDEVHERVSSILKDSGFCPSRASVNIGDLYYFYTPSALFQI